MTRKLNINLDELADALDSNWDETSYYLDMETGGLFMLSPDVTYEMRHLREIMAQQTYPDFEAALSGSDLPDWLKEEARTAYRIGINPSRYLPVQSSEPFAGYDDMEAFIETVADERLAAGGSICR